MAETGKTSAGAARTSKYDGVDPVRVDAVSVMSPADVEKAWRMLYVAAGIASGDESKKLGVRCAVYCYFAVNGTSSVGEYSGDIVPASGTSFQAVVIVNAIGRYDIRRFARANAAESVEYFHYSGILQKLEAMVAKCEIAEIRPADAIALCDWLDGAKGLTPAERVAQAGIKAFALSRARGARGGQSVEQLRDGRLTDMVEAQSSAPVVKKPGDAW